MNKYEILLNILDKIREEAKGAPNQKRYLPEDDSIEQINQARARAYIHLYLMVNFGLLDFKERERVITDNSYDGGIDAYYIDQETRKVYLIQSKFRTNHQNFTKKNIGLEEILSMDINRILDGNEVDEAGNPYNGKIKQLIREVSELDNIARYSYHVVLLANMETYTDSEMKRLFEKYPVEIIDHEKCFSKLVFPVVSGTHFQASELNIYLDLSNKNAGSKISYEVKTEHGDCDITVLFVPTIEIARTLSKYKNSILQHNPRSYLEIEGQKVNNAIRETILKRTTNEFALFNNGITMISDDTNLNERIGQRSKAQLAVRNPQIINGGQTAYTLSKIFDESTEEEAINSFAGKEVLLKIITLTKDTQSDLTPETKMKLIDAISTATNQQTVVMDADRVSNDPAYTSIQSVLFQRYGILFERKRGEFGDGLNRGYVEANSIIERNFFFRIYLASNGSTINATEKKLFVRAKEPESVATDLGKLDNFYFGLLCAKMLGSDTNSSAKKGRDFYSKIYLLTQFKPDSIDKYKFEVEKLFETFNDDWEQFLKKHETEDTRFNKSYLDRETGKERSTFNFASWYKSNAFEDDMMIHFKTQETETK